MNVDVATSIVIERPLSIVFAYTVDPDRAPEWYENIRSAEWKTPRPLAIGSRIAFVAKFLGRRMAYTYEIVELVPESRLTMRTSEGPFPMETSYGFADTGSGTEVTLRNRGSVRGIAGLFAPMMALAMRRANRKDLRRLKETVERS